jgi:hypothetical protein
LRQNEIAPGFSAKLFDCPSERLTSDGASYWEIPPYTGPPSKPLKAKFQCIAISEVPGKSSDFRREPEEHDVSSRRHAGVVAFTVVGASCSTTSFVDQSSSES